MLNFQKYPKVFQSLRILVIWHKIYKNFSTSIYMPQKIALIWIDFDVENIDKNKRFEK